MCLSITYAEEDIGCWHLGEAFVLLFWRSERDSVIESLLPSPNAVICQASRRLARITNGPRLWSLTSIFHASGIGWIFCAKLEWPRIRNFIVYLLFWKDTLQASHFPAHNTLIALFQLLAWFPWSKIRINIRQSSLRRVSRLFLSSLAFGDGRVPRNLLAICKRGLLRSNAPILSLPFSAFIAAPRECVNFFDETKKAHSSRWKVFPAENVVCIPGDWSWRHKHSMNQAG